MLSFLFQWIFSYHPLYPSGKIVPFIIRVSGTPVPLKPRKLFDSLLNIPTSCPSEHKRTGVTMVAGTHPTSPQSRSAHDGESLPESFHHPRIRLPPSNLSYHPYDTTAGVWTRWKEDQSLQPFKWWCKGSEGISITRSTFNPSQVIYVHTF